MDTTEMDKKYLAHSIMYEDLIQAFEKAQIKIRFPISHNVLGDLSKRMTYIYDGIINGVKSDNLYSVFILYRSLLEHFYKFIYILDKMITSADESAAESYQKHYFISEYLAEQAGVLDMEDLINDSVAKTDFVEFIRKKHPDLTGFDKANQQEISAAIKQFNLKDIVKYLYARYRDRDSTKSPNQIVAQTFPEYSFVSTFSHGGSYASVLMEKFKNKNQIEDQLLRLLQISLTSTCVAKENYFMTYEIDSSFTAFMLQFQLLRSY